MEKKISEKNINELLDALFEAKLLTGKQCRMISFCVAFTFDSFNNALKNQLKIWVDQNLKY